MRKSWERDQWSKSEGVALPDSVWRTVLTDEELRANGIEPTPHVIITEACFRHLLDIEKAARHLAGFVEEER